VSNENLVRAQRIGVAELSQLYGVTAQPPPRAFINELGGSDVQMRFQGWVDQRSHDFLQVRSEAIRNVKLALDAAGMDMPEPIYPVQLSEPSKMPAASAPQREVVAKADAQSGPVDTSAHADLLNQVEHDRQTRESADLLDPAAPRE
jgi:small conductance mechanosensitive channel